MISAEKDTPHSRANEKPQQDGERKSESCSVISDSLQPHELYSPWNSPGQNTGVGSRSLLQDIEPESPALQADSLPAEPPGKPLSVPPPFFFN